MFNNHQVIGIQALWLFILLDAPGFAQSTINRSLAATDKAGVIEPFKNTEVATAETGVVRDIFVKAGDTIDEGTPIGRLDNEQQRAQVHEAEIEVSSLGTLETARSEVVFNRRRLEEISKLVEAGKGSPKERERFQLEMNIALAKLQAQEESKLSAQARLEKAQLLLRERTVRAPHRGIVVEVYKDIGEYVAGNAPALIRLIDTSKLRARFFLSDEVAERYRKSGQAEIRLSNHNVVIGKIEFIAPFANAEGGGIEMTVLIDNENGSIRSANCELILP